MTESVWEGKYDKDGRRVALPFQAVETVNEPARHSASACSTCCATPTGAESSKWA